MTPRNGQRLPYPISLEAIQGDRLNSKVKMSFREYREAGGLKCRFTGRCAVAARETRKTVRAPSSGAGKIRCALRESGSCSIVRRFFGVYFG